MNITFSLFKMLFSQTFFSGSFFEDLKSGGKKTAKCIGYILLAIYCVGIMGGMYFLMINSMYTTFKLQGMEHFILILVGFSAFVITFVFGFLASISTYILSPNEEFLLSLPFKTSQLLQAKFFSTCVLECLFGFAIIGLGCGIFGFHEGLLLNPFYYIAILIAAITIPLISMSLCYLLLMLILNVFKFLKNKALLTNICTTVLVIFIIILNIGLQELLTNLDNPEYVEKLLNSDVISGITSSTYFLPPIGWFANAMNAIKVGKVLSPLIYLTLLLIFALVTPLLLLPLLSKLYLRSVAGFSEVKTKKLESSKQIEYIKSDIRSTPLLKALFLRDVNSVLRETTWFFNGPLLLIILPVVFFFSFVVGIVKGYSSETDITNILVTIPILIEKVRTIILTNSSSKVILLFIAPGIIALINTLVGTSTSIAATSISREGKGFQNILAMPIPLKTLLKAKMMHAIMYFSFVVLFFLILSIIALTLIKPPLTPLETVFFFVNQVLLSYGLGFFVSTLDMNMDIANPKLEWENPLYVFKQNMTTFFAVLLSMGITILLIVIGIFIPHNPYILFLLGLVISGLDYFYWIKSLNTAEKKLRKKF